MRGEEKMRRGKEKRWQGCLPVHGPACIGGAALTQPQTGQGLRRVQTARIHCAGCCYAALTLLLGAVFEAGAATEVAMAMAVIGMCMYEAT